MNESLVLSRHQVVIVCSTAFAICNALPESHALSKEDYRELHARGERCSFSTLLNTARAARGLIIRFGAKRYAGEGPLLRLVQRQTSGCMLFRLEKVGIATHLLTRKLSLIRILFILSHWISRPMIP